MASAHGSTLIPTLRYRDAHAAIAWLVDVFGFTRQAVYDGPDGTVAHAQLTLGDGMIMLGSLTTEAAAANRIVTLDETGGRETIGMYLVIQDCDAMYAKAKAAGATIVGELISPEYGGQAFSCRDLEGHIWSIGSYDPWAPAEQTHE